MAESHLREAHLLAKQHIIQCHDCQEEPGWFGRLFGMKPRRCDNYRLTLVYIEQIELLNTQQVMQLDALDQTVKKAEAIAPNDPKTKHLRQRYNQERDEVLG